VGFSFESKAMCPLRHGDLCEFAHGVFNVGCTLLKSNSLAHSSFGGAWPQPNVPTCYLPGGSSVAPINLEDLFASEMMTPRLQALNLLCFLS